MIFTKQQQQDTVDILNKAGRSDLANTLIIELQESDLLMIESNLTSQKLAEVSAILVQPITVISILGQARKALGV
jgi:hypothetical protein